jgi:RNA polymerase primary sigma factor
LAIDLPEPEAAFNPAMDVPFEPHMEELSSELETLVVADDVIRDELEPDLEASGEAPDTDDDEDDDSDEEEVVETAAAPEAKKSEEPQSFLSMYFRDMAELDVLRPEQEFETARHIEDLELALWRAVLGFVPWAAHVADTVEAAVGAPVADFKPYRLQAERTGTRPSAALRKKFDKLVDGLAVRLKEMDIDRVFVDAALAEMHRLDGAAQMGRPIEGLSFPTNTRAFRAFVQATTAKAGVVKRAKNEFVKANLRLVVSIARRFNHGRLPLPDLIQEGNIGLMKAVERYDYRRGFRFSTYASWWIRHAISRALADKGRAVRLPVHMIDAYHRIAKSERELQSKLERPATTEEIASVTGIEAEKLEKMRTFLADNPVSLDRSLSDDDGRRLIDVLVDPNEAPSPPEQMMSSETQREMLKLLGGLKPIEADILRKRFGLVNDRERTLKEIGDEYRLSRERVRQLQEQALGKMRKAMAKREIL